MSYIECKSFVTGKENVQYGLIDVELIHNRNNSSISFNNPRSNLYYNTSPDSFGTNTVKKNPHTETGWAYDGVVTRGITGRPDHGALNSNYVYVPNGKFPIISRQIINEKNLNEGVNTFDLFETTNNKVILEVTKLKNSDISIYKDSFVDLDGSVVENPYIIPSVRIVQILKSNNKVISECDMLSLCYGGVTYPIEFTLDTVLFRIKNFNPAYAASSHYERRIGSWYDGESGSGNKMYVEGGISDAEGDFVGMEFSILSTEYWRGEVTSGTNKFQKNKIVNSDGSEVTDKNKKNLNTNAHIAWIRNEISVNPNTFINFSVANGFTNHKVDTNSAINTFAESYSNGNKEYKTISSDGDNEKIYIGNNMLITPIIVPYVDSNYNPLNDDSNGIYIPLTSTVFEEDPEEPVDPDDPDDPDEPEDVEPADDPDTDYTPVIPGDISTGFEEWPYPSNEVIDGEPDDMYTWDPLYTNFIFKSYFKSNTGVFQPDSAWEFINDCTNASISEPFHALFKIATGHPTMQELIARIYELPFDYDLIFTNDAMLKMSTINYGYVGILTVGFGNDGKADTTVVHYYKRTTKKFYPLNLGSMKLQKVFNNYLDYTDTVYKLNLPYGAGVVELDPNLLFDYGRVTAVINIKGYLDIDTGFLVIKVLLNNQIYYETSVNVAVDMIANSTDAMAVPVTLTKMIGGLSAGSLGTAMMMESRYNYSKMLAETKNILSKEKQEKITEETEKRLNLAEESWNRMHSARKGDDNNVHFNYR